MSCDVIWLYTSSSCALFLNVSNKNDSYPVIYINALSKSLRWGEETGSWFDTRDLPVGRKLVLAKCARARAWMWNSHSGTFNSALRINLACVLRQFTVFLVIYSKCVCTYLTVALTLCFLFWFCQRCWGCFKSLGSGLQCCFLVPRAFFQFSYFTLSFTLLSFNFTFMLQFAKSKLWAFF